MTPGFPFILNDPTTLWCKFSGGESFQPAPWSPRSGETWIVQSTVPAVARSIASNGEVDFIVTPQPLTIYFATDTDDIQLSDRSGLALSGAGWAYARRIAP